MDMTSLETGYFARATENGHSAKHTQVHVYSHSSNRALCGYRPHKTMLFQWVSRGITPPYVECSGCLAKCLKLGQFSNKFMKHFLKQ
jgi:hypothetical protein